MRAPLFVFATFGDLALGIKRINKRIKVRAVIAHRRERNRFTRDDLCDDGFPDGERHVRFEAVHVVPKALRGERGLGRLGEMPPSRGGGKPVKHGAFAQGMDGTVERRQRQILPGAQALLALGTVPVDVTDNVGPLTFLPERRGQAKVEDFCVLRSRATALDRVEDILRFAQVFLPQAPTFAIDQAPFGVVVIDMAFDAFLFQAFHVVSRPPRKVLCRYIRGYTRHYKPYLSIYKEVFLLGHMLNNL